MEALLDVREQIQVLQQDGTQCPNLFRRQLLLLRARTSGTNRLATAQDLPAMVETILAGHWAEGACPELWDGQTAGRVADDLKARLT